MGEDLTPARPTWRVEIMHIALAASGSRGDIQPMLALAVGLRAAGHDAVFCASPDNADLARRLEIAFAPMGEPLRDNSALEGWGFGPFDAFIRRQIHLQAEGLPEVIRGCSLVLASGLAWGVRPAAEASEITYRYISFVPAGFLGTTRDAIGTRLARGLAARYADFTYGPALDRARGALGLRRRRLGVMQELMGPDAIAATDPALTVLPSGGRLRVLQTGYPLLPDTTELSAELQRFLDAGPPPVYAGFGSMPIPNGERVARHLVEAAQLAGLRLVISRGWGRLPTVDHGPTCLFVDDEPHQQLFPRVVAVIHHGGAGTVATAARAGVPQIVVPHLADQFMWRGQVVALGLGPRASMLRTITAASLAKAIAAAVTDPGYRRRAQEVAEILEVAPDGITTTVAAVSATSS